MASGSDNSRSRALTAFRGTRQREGAYGRRWSSRLRSNRIETSWPWYRYGPGGPTRPPGRRRCLGRFRRAEFLAGACPGCVPRNAGGDGNYRSPRQEPADRDPSTRPACAVGESSPARAGGRHARTAVCRAFPPVRVDLAPEEMAGLAEQPIIVVAWAAVPDEAHARSRRDRPAGYHSTGGGPVPGSQGDHRIVALRSTRESCTPRSPGGPTSISPGAHVIRSSPRPSSEAAGRGSRNRAHYDECPALGGKARRNNLPSRGTTDPRAAPG
jgi:hypothetical protein